MEVIAQEQSGGDARSLGVARDDDVRQQVKMLAGALAILGFFVFGIVAPQWYFGVVVVGLVLALLARWPMVGLFAMALTAPFIAIEARWGEVNVPVVDVVAMATVVAVGIRFLATRGAARSFDKPKMTSEGVPIFFFAAFLLAAALSLVNAADVFASFKYLLRPLLFFAIAYLAVPVVVIQGRPSTSSGNNGRVVALLWAFATVGITVAAMGLFSLYGQEDVAIRRVLPIPIFGIYPLGTNQNQIAEVLLVTLPVLWLLAAQVRSLRAKRALALLSIPVAFILLATLSRAGWIALAVEAAVFLFLAVRPTKRQLGVGAIVVSFLILPLLDSFIRLATVEAGASATENRLLMTTTAVGLWQEHPWIGNGAGSFVELLGSDRRYGAKFGTPLDAHGVLLKLLVETGLLGTAIFGLFWLALARTFWQSYEKATSYHQDLPKGDKLSRHSGTPPWRWQATSSMALWLALFLGTSVFQLFGTSYFLGRFWLPIGIGLAAIHNRKLVISNS